MQLLGFDTRFALFIGGGTPLILSYKRFALHPASVSSDQRSTGGSHSPWRRQLRPFLFSFINLIINLEEVD